jgi:hypothetical protein
MRESLAAPRSLSVPTDVPLRPYGGLGVLEGVVGLGNHCAEPTEDEGGDEVLYSSLISL